MKWVWNCFRQSRGVVQRFMTSRNGAAAPVLSIFFDIECNWVWWIPDWTWHWILLVHHWYCSQIWRSPSRPRPRAGRALFLMYSLFRKWDRHPFDAHVYNHPPLSLPIFGFWFKASPWKKTRARILGLRMPGHVQASPIPPLWHCRFVDRVAKCRQSDGYMIRSQWPWQELNLIGLSQTCRLNSCNSLRSGFLLAFSGCWYESKLPIVDQDDDVPHVKSVVITW